jgi:hypothetical protein
MHAMLGVMEGIRDLLQSVHSLLFHDGLLNKEYIRLPDC